MNDCSFHYFGFGFLSWPVGSHVYAHAVAVEGVHGVAFGHEDGFVVLVGYHRVLAVVAPHESAYCHVCALRRFECSGRNLDDFAVECHFGQHECHLFLAGGARGADGVSHLLVVE